MDNLALRQFLAAVQFYVLETQFVLVVGLTLASMPRLVRELAPPRWAIGAAACAAAVAIAVVVLLVPRTNRIYYDEHIYQGVAQNLADARRAEMCNEGTVEYGRLDCARGEYVKQPYGYPYLLSVGYRLVGTTAAVAHAMNALSAGAFVVATFFAAALLWQSWSIATAAAIGAAILPEHLRWSGTAASEPTAALMLSLAIVGAAWYARSRTPLSLVWMVASAAFAIQFRVESILILPVIALLLVMLAPDVLRRRSFWLAVAAGAVLCSVHLGHLIAVRNEGWGASGDRISTAYIWPNLLTNAAYFLDNQRFPAVLTAAAILGAWSRPRPVAVVLVLMFAAFFGVYLLFYAGSYDYGADVRYALMAHPAVVLLAGAGAIRVIEAVQRIGGRAVVSATLGTATALHVVSFLPHVRAVGEEAWAARADVEFSESQAPRLGPAAMVLTHNPSVFLLRGVNAAQLSLAVSDTMYVAYAMQSRYSGGVFLHWDFWCNADATRRDICADALSRLPHVPAGEARRRDQRFAFYRLEPWPAEHARLPLKLLTK